MSYINLYKVERVYNNKQQKKVWIVSSNLLNTFYIEKTKKLALEKAKELNDKFNRVSI